MKMLGRVIAFGFVSGLVWSVVPGILANLFMTTTDVPATVVAGIIAGIATSALLGSLVAKFGRGVAVMLGLLSLPIGSFVFGFALALIDRFLPALASGTRAPLGPWTLGLNYAVLSVISIFAIGLFPLAVFTTLFLRAFIVRGNKTNSA